MVHFSRCYSYTSSIQPPFYMWQFLLQFVPKLHFVAKPLITLEKPINQIVESYEKETLPFQYEFCHK